MTEETPACPLCFSEHTGIYYELPDRFHAVGELYHIYECADCGIIFLYPTPKKDRISTHYGGIGYDPFIELEGVKSWRQKVYSMVKPWSLKWKVRLINRFHLKPGTLLEVGAGTGAFLKLIASLGWKVFGLEPDENAALFAKKNWNLQIISADLADNPDFQQPFDIITFWHSLEHIPRLKENLRVASEILNSPGWLFIALPNPDSLDARRYQNYWVAWDAPRHLWHFKAKVLQTLVANFGLKYIHAFSMPFDPFYNALLSEYLIPSSGRFWRLILRFPLISIASFLKGIVNPLNGSSVVYVFKKV